MHSVVTILLATLVLLGAALPTTANPIGSPMKTAVSVAGGVPTGPEVGITCFAPKGSTGALESFFQDGETIVLVVLTVTGYTSSGTPVLCRIAISGANVEVAK